VRKVFKATSRAAQNGEDSYDAGKSRLHQVGRKHILALDSDDARIAVHELETGGSRKSATEFVNQHRRENGLEAVGVSTIYNLMHRLGVVTTRVRRRPQGDFSPNSKWAKARFNWVRQLGVFYRTWAWDDAEGPCPQEFDPVKIPHIKQEQIAFWDETAKKCELDGAHASQYQHRFLKNEQGHPDPNGTLGPEVKKMVPKFQQRCDMAVGVATWPLVLCVCVCVCVRVCVCACVCV
jgi:hypothetical protein